MRIKCRDASKFTKEMLFCIHKKLYKIAITVEQVAGPAGYPVDNGDDGYDKGDDGKDRDDFDDVEDLKEEDLSHVRVDKPESQK
jgi:hypothetical protein